MVNATGGIFGYLDVLTGGAFSRSTLFALSISPYITASIVIQLLTVAIPYLENLAKEGEEGKRRLNRITRYTTLGLALLQAYAYMTLLNAQGAIESFDGWQYYFARVIIVMCFTAGAMLIVFLGERIDERGIGNGISMILFIGIVSRGGAVLNTMWQYIKYAMEGYTFYFFGVPLVVVMFLFVIAFIIVMTNAERRITVQYAKRIVGRKQYGGQTTFLPIKVNMSGVLPIIFASTILAIPSTINGFVNAAADSFLGKFLSLFNYNTLLYAVIYFILIIGFNYFYVAIQYNPIEISNNLRKNSGTVPGIRPGKPTSDYLAKISGRLTMFGSLFLAVVAILPTLALKFLGQTSSFGATSVLIMVSVALETTSQLESHMLMRHYKGFLN
ncbi:Protein translocase subunit SecY [bioreactor metagenome]|uniref:Protein translocase subunit SecY n=1 Tax=bioreactor metagenome TaxID=1076179 RepID=A0A644Z8X4_9ZZZZ